MFGIVTERVFMRELARSAFVLLMVSAIAIPFARIAGPLSADDLFPLFAVCLALGIAALTPAKASVFDMTTLAFLGLALAGLLSSAANATSLAELMRFAGRSSGRAVFYLSLIIGTRVLLDDRRWVERALWLFALVATAEAIFCLYAFATGYQGPFGYGVADIPSWSVLKGHERVHGTFSGELLDNEYVRNSANFLAGYTLLTIPLTGSLVVMTRRRWLRALILGATLAQIATLYLTYTRAALLALAVATLAAGWLVGRRKTALAIIVVGALATVSIPTMRAKFLKEGHNRYALWWAAARSTEDNVMLGIGDGRYAAVLRETPSYHETPYGVANSTPHNSILLSAVNHGILGGLSHLLLDLFALWIAARTVRRSTGPGRYVVAALGAGICGFVVQDQFNNLSYIPKVATQMWFLFALLPLAARHLGGVENASVAEPAHAQTSLEYA